MRPSRKAALWLSVLALLGAGTVTGALTPAASAADTPVASEGYVTVADGTRLHYSLTVPSSRGKYATVFQYDPYSAGTKGGMISGVPGYAVIGVNLRGTGCSGGTADINDSKTWSDDGAQVVEWIARQPWSSGHVGMVGTSFPGLSQLGVARLHPPHLDAITPLSPSSDSYRDTIYKGGIYNPAFGTAYPLALQPALDGQALAGAAGDPQCASGTPEKEAAFVAANPAVHWQNHPFIDSYWDSSSQRPYGERITIPVLGCATWQDNVVYPRGAEIFFPDRMNPRTTWFVGSDGGHGACEMPAGMTQKFLDRYVKGIKNGFEKTAHVTLVHGNLSAPGCGEPAVQCGAVSTTRVHDWSQVLRPTTLSLRAGGLLSASAATGSEAADSYASPDSAGGAIYTTRPLAKAAELFGPGSLNLWLSSTAEDTDLEVTIAEVTASGTTVNVAAGWLRMSHRKLDPRHSSALRPFQTHLAADAEPLQPGRATFARVELFPSDHIFAAGSRIQLRIAAPDPSMSNSNLVMTPALNRVFHDRVYASRLVLGLVPGSRLTFTP